VDTRRGAQTLQVSYNEFDCITLKNGEGLSGETYSDDKPYTTLSYANGKTFENTYTVPIFDPEHPARRILTNDEFEAVDAVYPAAAQKGSETHAGDDVGIWAYGPMVKTIKLT